MHVAWRRRKGAVPRPRPDHLGFIHLPVRVFGLRTLVVLPGLSDDEFQTAMLKEMGSIKNVSRLYLQELATEHEVGLGQGFGAFDMESSILPKPETLDVLAKLFGHTAGCFEIACSVLVVVTLWCCRAICWPPSSTWSAQQLAS